MPLHLFTLEKLAEVFPKGPRASLCVVRPEGYISLQKAHTFLWNLVVPCFVAPFAREILALLEGAPIKHPFTVSEWSRAYNLAFDPVRLFLTARPDAPLSSGTTDVLRPSPPRGAASEPRRSSVGGLFLPSGVGRVLDGGIRPRRRSQHAARFPS